MEARFGHDFGRVRIHTDDRAVESARAVGARAFTLGSDVVFGQGQYQPETSPGMRLIAHELAHVVQQERVGMLPVQSRGRPLLSRPSDDAERQAEQAADHALAGAAPAAGLLTASPSLAVIQRQVDAPPGTETGVADTAPASEPRYNLTIGNKVLENVTRAEAIRALRRYHKRLLDRVETDEERHRMQKEIRDDQWIVGAISDFLADPLSGGIDMPPLGMWTYPRISLIAAEAILNAGDVESAVQALVRAEDTFQHCHRRLYDYIEGTISGAETSVTALKVTAAAGAVAATVATGGAATTAGVGLLGTSAAVGAVGGAYGATQEAAGQAGEMIAGTREAADFDVGKILRRGAVDAATNFVGAIAGGALSRYATRFFGSYLSNVGDDVLMELGQQMGLRGPLPRDFFLTSGQRFVADFFGNIGASPLQTAVSTVLNSLTGAGPLPTAEQFIQRVIDEMVQGGAMQLFFGAFTHGYGVIHGTPGADGGPAAVLPGESGAPPAEIPGGGVTPETPTVLEPRPVDLGETGAGGGGSSSGPIGPAAGIPEHPGAFLERGVYDVTSQKSYIVRAGPPGLYGDHLFTSLAEAEAYARHLASTGEIAIRETSALPRVWPGGAEGNPVDVVRVFEVPVGTPYIQGVVGPQAEGGTVYGAPVTYEGGGPQVVLDRSVRLAEPLVEVPVGEVAPSGTGGPSSAGGTPAGEVAAGGETTPGGSRPEAAVGGLDEDRALDEAFSGGQDEGAYATTPRLARGNLGERLAAEALAADGHQILSYKPSILGTNQGGIDIVSMRDGTVYLIDNKALSRDGNIASVSALTTNFDQNLAAVRAELTGMLARPGISAEEQQVIRQALDVLESGNVVRAVTNANVAPDGQVPSGVTQRLQNEGLVFIDVVR